MKNIEEDLLNLEKAMSLIILGLYEREKNFDGRKYYCSLKLNHGISIFQNLNIKYSSKSTVELLKNFHEYSFFENYIYKPLKEWFSNWDIEMRKRIKEKSFYSIEQIAYKLKENYYQLDETCEEYLYSLEKDVLAFLEEKNVYNELKKTDQNIYVELRKFIILNPIVKGQKLGELKQKFNLDSQVIKILDLAYERLEEEAYKCPYCGWTYTFKNNIPKCQTKECIEKRYEKEEINIIHNDGNVFRLRRGVMKYIAIPGKLELELANFCEKNNVKYELWPEMDKYDINIIFNNDEIWSIDIKDIKEPKFLNEIIKKQNGFKKGNFEKGFYAINSFIKKRHEDYCIIINKELKKLDLKNVECIFLDNLKKKIKRRSRIQ